MSQQLLPAETKPTCCRGPEEPLGSKSSISPATKEISWKLCASTIPMIAFSTVLLILVFRNRLPQMQSHFDELQPFHNATDPAHIFVDISAPTLVFIASWSSTAAVALAGFVSSLALYPFARDLRTSRTAAPPGPTPRELGEVLVLSNGGGMTALIPGLWKTLRFKWRSRCRALGAIHMRYGLVFTLSIAISAVDTWLHVTTKSVEYTKLRRARDPPGMPWEAEDSVFIKESCFNNSIPMYNEQTTTLSISACGLIGSLKTEQGLTRSESDSYFMKDSIELLGGTDERLSVYNYSQYAYVGKRSDVKWPYYGRERYDLLTNAFAVSTTCKPIEESCDVLKSVNSSNIPFRCKSLPAFSGNLGGKPVAVTFFDDATGTNSNVSYTMSDTMHFALGFNLATDIDAGPGVTELSYTSVILLSCYATVYEAEYAWVNGSVRSFTTRPANASVTRVFMTPIAFSNAGHYKLYFDAQLAGVSTRVLQDFIDSVSLSYSRMIAAFAQNALEFTTTRVAEERTNIIVAKVPVAPLFMLIAANLLFVVTAIVLAWEAFWASRRGAPWQLKMRLGIPALVAKALGEQNAGKQIVASTKEMFAESFHAEGCKGVASVGLDETSEGGWELRTAEKSPHLIS